MTMMTSSSRNNTNSTNNSSSATVSARYPRYPAYRDSGVEWLGEIPAHWEVKRLKYTLPLRGGKLDSKPTDAIYLGLEHIESETGQLLLDTQPEEVDSVVATFEAGDVLFGKLRPYLAKVARPDFAGACTSEILPLRPTRQITQDYGFYALLNTSLISAINSLTYGTRMPRVSPEQIGTYAIALPPLPEQRAIAAFLDRETARIDALIAKKERLIELLQEKRAAVITQAVTKGLDPTVPMKDSGVEWLGEVPAHWAGLPLKRWVSEKITDGPHETPEFTSDGVPFISAESISNGRIDFEKKRGYITSDLHQQYRKKIAPTLDDILICKSGATTGKFAMVEVEFEFSVWSPLALIRVLRQRALPRFVARVLESEYVQDQIKKTWSAGTQPNISMQDLERLWLVCPPVSEQVEILTFLASRLGRFDELVEGVRKAIVALVELRTALISAAVTGKIDVREG